MVRTLWTGLITASALWLLSSSPAQARTQVASVRFILHGLSVQPAGHRIKQAHIHQQLFASDRLLTRAGQKASLSCVDQSTLFINQQTDLVLHSPTLLFLSGGEVAVNDHPGSHILVETGTAVSAAVGTLYDVRIQAPTAYGTSRFPAGTTTVSVVAGSVRVSNRFGAVLVQPGQWTHVPPGRAPTRPTRHNAGQDVRWTAGLP